MKKILLFFLLYSIISCDIQYDGEKRLIFETQVLNADGQPLPNSNVEITVSNGYTSNLISQGTTDQNGRITLVFPAPLNDDSINLKIYNDDTYLQKEIFNISKTDFEGYKFIYPNASLLKFDETAPLGLTFNQTSSNTIISKLSINGIYNMFPEYYNYDPENYYYPNEILLKKNQSFQLKYRVLNLQTNQESDHTVDLLIANDPINYTINY